MYRVAGRPGGLLIVVALECYVLALAREFESRREEILNLFAKIKKDQLLRAPSVGKHSSTRVDEGRKS